MFKSRGVVGSRFWIFDFESCETKYRQTRQFVAKTFGNNKAGRVVYKHTKECFVSNPAQERRLRRLYLAVRRQKPLTRQGCASRKQLSQQKQRWRCLRGQRGCGELP